MLNEMHKQLAKELKLKHLMVLNSYTLAQVQAIWEAHSKTLSESWLHDDRYDSKEIKKIFNSYRKKYEESMQHLNS